ncbi:MAG: c-type cytochrome biogenesis protein CcmI [Rhodoferax sp.]
MIGFLAAGAALVVLALALLFRPFYWKRASSGTSRRALNAAIYRDQLAKLDRDRDEQMIGAEDHAQARTELQRMLIEDASVDDATVTLRPPKKTLLAVGIVLPLAAIGFYLWLGSPATLEPSGAQHQMQAQDLDRMLDTLVKKLEKEPENVQGWAMLARSYKSMGRNLEAERAFSRTGALLDTDAQLLAAYADVVASNANGNLAGKPMELIEKALRIEPDNGMALWLLGTAAFQRNEFAKAIQIWERLAQQLTPGSEDDQMLQNTISQTYAKLGKTPPTARAAAPATATKAATAAKAPTDKAGAANAAASVSGQVDLDAALKDKVGPNDIVMVIARLPGSRMPLAVARLPAAPWPVKFSLDDSLAMNPQSLLSTAGQVEVEIRISKTGMAMPQAGDLLSAAQTVKVGASGLKLRVDHVRP